MELIKLYYYIVIDMNLKFFVLFFILLVILLSTKYTIERFIDDLTYRGKIFIEQNADVNGKVIVDDTVNTPKLCVINTDKCFNNDNIAFVKNDMPNLSPNNVCIGNECITKDDLLFLKNNKITKTNKLVFSVKSSGLVVGKRGGLCEFYINNTRVEDLPISRGFNVLVVTPYGTKHNFGSFDTHADYANVNRMIQFINNIPNNYYVLVGIYDEATHRDSPYIEVYEHIYSEGWKMKYKLNSNGSETKAYSTWNGPSHGVSSNLFPNDSITSLYVSDKITAKFYEHDFDQGYTQTVVGDRYINRVDQNDRISSIKFYKTNQNEIVTPYEAMISCGGSGGNAPDYRGSFILIGQKGMRIGLALEKTMNSRNGAADTLIAANKTFTTPYTFLDIVSN
jgi:hypothetical protein